MFHRMSNMKSSKHEANAFPNSIFNESCVDSAVRTLKTFRFYGSLSLPLFLWLFFPFPFCLCLCPLANKFVMLSFVNKLQEPIVRVRAPVRHWYYIRFTFSLWLYKFDRLELCVTYAKKHTALVARAFWGAFNCHMQTFETILYIYSERKMGGRIHLFLYKN